MQAVTTQREECRVAEDAQCVDCGVFLPTGSKAHRVSEDEHVCPGCEGQRREADARGMG